MSGPQSGRAHKMPSTSALWVAVTLPLMVMGIAGLTPATQHPADPG